MTQPDFFSIILDDIEFKIDLKNMETILDILSAFAISSEHLID